MQVFPPSVQITFDPAAPAGTTATLIELSHRVSSGIAFGAVMLLGVLVWRGTSDGAPARQ